MRADAWAGAQSARICFFVNDFIILIILLTSDNQLTQALSYGHHAYVLAFFTLGLASVANYLLIGYVGPGYLEKGRLLESNGTRARYRDENGKLSGGPRGEQRAVAAEQEAHELATLLRPYDTNTNTNTTSTEQAAATRGPLHRHTVREEEAVSSPYARTRGRYAMLDDEEEARPLAHDFTTPELRHCVYCLIMQVRLSQ